MNRFYESDFISVIMPVYNSESYILESVNSILNQTFSNFEFIIINDGSTDNSFKILKTITDKRIIKINHTLQKGNYKCRNEGIELARGKYIAVMDSDDIAHKDRFLKQINFLEENKEYLAVGSNIEFFSEDNKVIPFKRLADKHQLKVSLLKDNVCTHPTLMIRKEIFETYKINY